MNNGTLLSQELPDPAPPEILALFQPQPARMASTATSALFPSNDAALEKPKRTKSHRSGCTGNAATKKPKKERKNCRRSSTTAQTTTEQPVVEALRAPLPMASVPNMSVSNEAIACTIVDVLNAVRDSFDNMIAPAMEGSVDTLESRLRVRMLRFMTLNYVKQKVEEKQPRTISCDDIAKIMSDSLRRLNVEVTIS